MEISYFQEKIKQNQCNKETVSKILNRLGGLRVITFLLGIGSIVWANLEQNIPGYLVWGVLVGIFFILVRKYGKVEKQKCYYEAEEKVLNAYMARMGEEWKNFSDNGEAYIEDRSKVKDLDLLGRSSLYQYICVAHTPFGKKALAKALATGNREPEVILRKQEAVKELIEDGEFAIYLQTLSMQMQQDKEKEEGKELEAFIEEAEKQKSYVSKGMKIISIVLPFVTLFCLVIALLGFHSSQNYIIVEVGFVVQLLINFAQSGATNTLFAPIYKVNKKMSIYKDFLSALEEKKFRSPYLKKLQNEIMMNGSAAAGIATLDKLTTSISLRHNFIANIIMNGFLMWNIHCKDALGLWNKQYGKELRKWLEIIGEVEVLMSLAVIGRVKETYCFPRIVESKTPQFQFEDMRHPLIVSQKVVGNSLECKGTTCIITGSNMSGKTTFLRSIGVNLALAYAGAPVVAKDFETSYMEVFTSMRIEDRVDEGISTFYAELLRIKEMIEYSNRHLPMLTLIDEIFKGTNSADRILGATETIKKLGKPWLNVMVTTHDFELCKLANEDKRKTLNYHFEEYYRENQICFDYKIKEGRCKTTNAKYLLKMVGILEE